jgi:hypothetical protein
MSEPQVATAEGAAVAVAVAKPAEVKVKSVAKGSGDLLNDIAVAVENLTKTKALNLAEELFDTVEVSYVRLGGVLKIIKDNTWFDGSADFETYVLEKFGFKGRKADYLIQIYTDLVTKQIPWAKVHHLGWTKLKDLSPILTLENLDEWVAKAEKLTVLELQAALKAKNAPESADKPVDEFVKMNLKVKPDQKSIIDTAIAKAKGELNTQYDAVALENICAAYAAGGSVATTAQVDLTSVDAFIKSMDFMTLVTRIAELSPEWDISIEKAKAA